MVIEEKFKIKIPDADLSKLLTINNMVDYINQKQQSEESLWDKKIIYTESCFFYIIFRLNTSTGVICNHIELK